MRSVERSLVKPRMPLCVIVPFSSFSTAVLREERAIVLCVSFRALKKFVSFLDGEAGTELGRERDEIGLSQLEAQHDGGFF